MTATQSDEEAIRELVGQITEFARRLPRNTALRMLSHEVIRFHEAVYQAEHGRLFEQLLDTI